MFFQLIIDVSKRTIKIKAKKKSLTKSIYGSAERESIKVDESTFVHLAEFSLKFPDIDKSGGGSKEVARPETARWAAASSETDSNGSADVKVFKLGLTK